MKWREKQVSRVTADTSAFTCYGCVSAGQGAPSLAVSRQRLLEGADHTQQVEGKGVS